MISKQVTLRHNFLALNDFKLKSSKYEVAVIFKYYNFHLDHFSIQDNFKKISFKLSVVTLG
jgi:hypothetical protein